MVERVSCRGKKSRQPGLARWLAALVLVGTVQALHAASPASDINIATYNLRLNTAFDCPSAGPQRRDEVKALIRYHGCDIVGGQEGMQD